jgi:hypothetical protein
MRETPTVLQAGGVSLPASVTSAAPWPVTEDRFEQGDWETFRQQALWSLAWRIGDQPDARFEVVAVTTPRLREMNFQRDEEFNSMQQLLRPDLLILLGGYDLSMHQQLADEMMAVTIRQRRLFDKPTWGYALSPIMARLPLFNQHGCFSSRDRHRLATVEQRALPAAQAALPPASAELAAQPEAAPATKPKPMMIIRGSARVNLI